MSPMVSRGAYAAPVCVDPCVLAPALTTQAPYPLPTPRAAAEQDSGACLTVGSIRSGELLGEPRNHVALAALAEHYLHSQRAKFLVTRRKVQAEHGELVADEEQG